MSGWLHFSRWQTALFSVFYQKACLIRPSARTCPPAMAEWTGVAWRNLPGHLTNCRQIVSRCCWRDAAAGWRGFDRSQVSSERLFFSCIPPSLWLLCCHDTMWLSVAVQLSKFIHHGWHAPAGAGHLAQLISERRTRSCTGRHMQHATTKPEVCVRRPFVSRCDIPCWGSRSFIIRSAL